MSVAAALGMLLAGILLILLIIAVNGYHVAQEFAYMSVDRTKLAVDAKNGDEKAKRAFDVSQRTSFMLSGAQLGITVTGLLIGYVAEPFVGQALGVLLGEAGVDPAVSISVGTVLALLTATVIQMIFGELWPKNYAIANPEPLARALARSTQIYLAVFGWLITLFDKASNGLLRLFGMEPVEDVDSTATAKDLERIVEDSVDSGDLPPELAKVLDRSLEFPEQDVKHAMIPRSRAGVVRTDTTLGELRELMATGHSRYPVVSDQEEPLGVVQLVDLLATDLPDDATCDRIMHEPLIVPTLMSLPDALAELRAHRRQLACVIDEYGALDGVLTVEDITEEFVGELTDEHDEEPPPTVESHPGPDGGLWRMAGEVPVDELERELGHDLPEGEYETVAGMLIAHHGDLPQIGETVTVPLPDDPRELVLDDPVHRALEVEVLEIDRHVPAEVVARVVEVPSEDVEDVTAARDRAESGGHGQLREGSHPATEEETR